jgi:phage terminase large subunit-like protein
VVAVLEPKKQSDLVIEFIEGWCRVPEGKLVGQPVKLLPFQKEFIRAVYDNPDGTQQAILSIGRKNGKTALCAFLMLAHLVGPLAFQNSQLYSAAQSKDQAALLFDLAVKTIRQHPDLTKRVQIRESTKILSCPGKGTRYKALSAEAGTAFGASPIFCLHDELGQVNGERSQLYEALETAQQAHDHPLSIVISTQAPTDADLLSQLIDDARAGHDPGTVVQIHEFTDQDEDEKEIDPFSIEAIKQANPAYGVFQNATVLGKMADRAKRMPSREAAYRNLILNQRVETASPFVTKKVWDENGGELEGWGVCYGGLDLSDCNDLTSMVLVSESNKKINVRPYFWLPEADLAERSRADRVPYDVWAKDGFLMLTDGRSVEYRDVAKFIVDLMAKEDIRKIGFDRWNMRHLRPWLIEAGLSEAYVEDRFEEFGQGFISMSPALRTLEGGLLNSRLRHAGHPVLSMCAANAVVKMDEAGNRKLDKKRSRGRIDGMVALAMASAVLEEDTKQGRVYQTDPAHFTEDLQATA